MREEKKLGKLAIAEWDKRFDQIKEAFAEKNGVFKDLYQITNGYKHRTLMKKAFKILGNASKKVNGTRNPVRELIKLFVYDAALTTYEFWKKRHTIFTEIAEHDVEKYKPRKKTLPDFLDENFFKYAMHVVRTW